MSSVSEELICLQEMEMEEMTKQLQAQSKEIDELKSANGTLRTENDTLKVVQGVLNSTIERLNDQLCEKSKLFAGMECFNSLQSPGDLIDHPPLACAANPLAEQQDVDAPDPVPVEADDAHTTMDNTELEFCTHMGDHGKSGWPSVQKVWCFRVHRAKEIGKQLTRQQMQALISEIAVELHVTDYNPKRNWFYQILKRHKLHDILAGDKRVHSFSTDTQDWHSNLGQGSSNGPVEEDNGKKNRAVAKDSKLRFMKAPSSVAEPGLKRDCRKPQLLISRPRIRIIDADYESNTRAE